MDNGTLDKTSEYILASNIFFVAAYAIALIIAEGLATRVAIILFMLFAIAVVVAEKHMLHKIADQELRELAKTVAASITAIQLFSPAIFFPWFTTSLVQASYFALFYVAYAVLALKVTRAKQ